MTKQLYTIAGMEALLSNALEHASHGWLAIEKEKTITHAIANCWPPQIKAEAGTAEYHVAAMIENVKRAYDMIRREKDQQDDVMEKVNEVLGRK